MCRTPHLVCVRAGEGVSIMRGGRFNSCWTLPILIVLLTIGFIRIIAGFFAGLFRKITNGKRTEEELLRDAYK